MMNFGGQEKGIRPGCIGYTQFTQDSPRNRDVKDNSHLKDLPPEEPDRAVISAPICHGSSSSIRYRECLKNHAASIGGNVVDGCGEFMPSGEEGSLKAFICAACNCHRNFHRKEPNGGDAHSGSNWRSMVQLHHPLLPSPSLHHAHHHHHHHQKYSIVPPMTVAYGGGTGGSGGTESSSEDLNNGFQSNVGEVGAPPPSSNTFSKKRFRTKFTQEQKEKMLEFAEKVGWRLQKQEEEEIQKLCAEVGVKREVFKVWMHNNKNSNMMKKQQHPQQLPM